MTTFQTVQRSAAFAILLLAVTGCATPPRSVAAGRVTPFFITSNAPNAQVLTDKGNIVGNCPVQGQIEWLGQDRWRSPFGEMIEVRRNNKGLGLTDWDYYFTGKIVAPGYAPRTFREHIGYRREYLDGGKDHLVERIHINAFLQPLHLPQPAPPERQQQQQQQQQQQTVIIPDRGRDDAPAMGKVIVTSVVEGADIYVDGMFVGNAPANLTLTSGVHIIEVKRRGYRPFRRELRVLAGSEITLRAELEREE